MPVYLVERVLPGVTMAQVEALRATVEEICRGAQTSGEAIHYLGSIFTPGDSRCRCLFESPSAGHIRAINDAGGLPYTRIVMAVDLPGSGRQCTTSYPPYMYTGDEL